MKIIHENQTKKSKNNDVCIVIEYPFGDRDINGAIIELSGRYPSKGAVVNLKCKELAYIIEGSGRVVVEGEEVKIKKGDLILIEVGEKYFWEANLEMLTSCTPAWYPEQHKEVE